MFVQFFFGGGSSQKITAIRGGHVKKLVSWGGFMWFLNGASQIPPAPPSLIKNERSPRRYQDPVLWAWLKFFSSLRGTNSKATHYLLSYFFWLGILKSTTQSSCCEPFEAEHPKRYQVTFLTLESMMSTPSLLKRDSPSSGEKAVRWLIRLLYLVINLF